MATMINIESLQGSGMGHTWGCLVAAFCCELSSDPCRCSDDHLYGVGIRTGVTTTTAESTASTWPPALSSGPGKFAFEVLGFKPKVSHVGSQCSIMEPHPQLQGSSFNTSSLFFSEPHESRDCAWLLCCYSQLQNGTQHKAGAQGNSFERAGVQESKEETGI